MKPPRKPYRNKGKFVYLSPRERELYRKAEKAYDEALKKASPQ